MLGKNVLELLYRKMLQIRVCEDRLIEPILSNDVRCPVHLYTGEEAIAVGMCANLKNSDYVFSTHRSHGHYLAMDGDLNRLVAEIFCKETGCSKGRGGSMHVIAPETGMLGSAPIVAGTISLALGAALASSIRKDGRVTVSFFGDGASGEGALYESLNFAALKKLPVIFVCENNYYSTHMPILECRRYDNIHDISLPFKINGYCVDGNDVLQVYEIAKEAVEKCRNGEGPLFIEGLTYRQRGHVGPDDNIQGEHKDIRPQKEIDAWLDKDPIKRFEDYLKSEAMFDDSFFEKIKTEIYTEVENALEYAKSSPYPKEGELTHYVFK